MAARKYCFSWPVVAPCLALVAAGVFGFAHAAADATSADAVKSAEVKSAPGAGEKEAGEKEAGERKPGGKTARTLPAFTPEREAAALTFVTAHHPELAPLLAGLKLSRPNEYQRAIRKLFADSERLAHIREMQPKQYELKLREWMLESRIQLLVARLTMERTPALEAELRTALEEQLSIHRDLLSQERDRAQQRIVALDREINAIDVDREQVLKERFNRAMNSAGQKKQNLKSADGKSADSKNSDAPKNSDAKNTEPKKATP